MYLVRVCFFFNQKTAYEMRISDWSADVGSSDLQHETPGGSGIGGIAMRRVLQHGGKRLGDGAVGAQEIGERDRAGAGIPVQDTRVQAGQIGRAACRGRECQYV